MAGSEVLTLGFGVGRRKIWEAPGRATAADEAGIWLAIVNFIHAFAATGKSIGMFPQFPIAGFLSELLLVYIEEDNSHRKSEMFLLHQKKVVKETQSTQKIRIQDPGLEAPKYPCLVDCITEFSFRMFWRFYHLEDEVAG